MFDIPLIKTGFLAKLGDFIFEPKGLSFQKMDRESTYSWAELKRIGARPLKQFVGTDGEKIVLSGVIYPQYRGSISLLATLREMAARGISYRLIATDSKSGENLGLWVIRSIKDTRTLFADDGRPLKVEFTIDLESYADDL